VLTSMVSLGLGMSRQANRKSHLPSQARAFPP